MKKSLIIIGGGLSGLAAAIRFARFSPDVLLIEKHTKLGGLNSYYKRKNRIFETGLHAITNFAPPKNKHAPLNKLFRQLKLKRKNFVFYPQICSEILFENRQSLLFSNDFRFLQNNIKEKFPQCFDGFTRMKDNLDAINPFKSGGFQSAKKYIRSFIEDELLADMLLCPLMYYGSSTENDIDLNQFVIMFRSIYQEGMFRPAGTMQNFLDSLQDHYLDLGGKLLLGSGVSSIINQNNTIQGVVLENGQQFDCDHLLSTAGLEETQILLGQKIVPSQQKRLAFVESIFLLPNDRVEPLANKKTIVFFNSASSFKYQRPDTPIDPQSGVICFPSSFEGRKEEDFSEIRSTHLANFHLWKSYADNTATYTTHKKEAAQQSLDVLEKYIGKFRHHIIYQDTFTPITISRFTGKREGAIYGSPKKIKDGDIGFNNLFLAGTDQGFLGIIGSMLSGVSIVNQHILPKI